MTVKTKVQVFKWIVYTFLALLLLALQNSPDILSIGGVKPDFLFSFALFVALFENTYYGAIFASIVGLMVDFSKQTSVGFHGLLFLCITLAASWLIKKYFMTNYKNSMLFFFLGYVILEVFGFIFSYAIWYENPFTIFDGNWVGQKLYTTGMTPLVYLGVKSLYKQLNRKR